MPIAHPSTNPTPSTCGQVLAADGRELTLRSVRLDARAGGGIARVRVEQTFANPFAEPLAVTYRLPLPADAAVVGFCFRIGDSVVRGEIEGRERARERFEEALIDGRTASLLEQDRSSLFTQEVGNIPPGADLVVEVELDQPLLWADGGWEWRMPTTAAPRYLGAPGRVGDAARITPPIATDGRGPRLTGSIRIADELVGAVRSPSHELATEDAATGAVAALPREGVAMDRDLVVRWPTATERVGLRIETARGRGLEDAHGILTLTPPAPTAAGRALGRDVTLLLDTSGSMHGRPLEQMQALAAAIVEGLGPVDTLEMIEFSSRPRRWSKSPQAVGERTRRKALSWVRGLRASGGTEMHSAMIEATRAQSAESQRQVVLITDGLIGFEREIVRAALEGTPSAARLHVVGLGSAPNRSLTQAVARAGRGVEVLLGLDEGTERAARTLLAGTESPALVDLEIGGSGVRGVCPVRLPDVYAGSPARLSLALDPAGGEVVVRGRTADGVWQQSVAYGACPDRDETADGAHAAPVSLFGRERAEDLETRAATGVDVDAELEAVGRAFQIATRKTSWIAVGAERSVDPGAPLRRDEVAHALADGMSVEMLGLRSASGPVACSPPMAAVRAVAPAKAKKLGLTFGARRSRDAAAPGGGDGPTDLGALSSSFGDMDDEALADETLDFDGLEQTKAERSMPEEGGDGPVVLRGILRRVGQRSVVELAGDALAASGWTPPEATVTVVLDDGSTLVWQVADGTTAAGPLAAGAQCRLVLDGVADRVREIRWTLPTQREFVVILEEGNA